MAQSHLDRAWELVCLYDGMYGAGSIHAKGGCADSGISNLIYGKGSIGRFTSGADVQGQIPLHY